MIAPVLWRIMIRESPTIRVDRECRRNDMDTFTAFVTLRFVERLCAVIIGGVSIYLGYRLFLEVPERHDSSGKVVLPWDVSVVLTRVGPGIFFALFGASVVGASFFKGMEWDDVSRIIASKASETGDALALREHSVKVSGAGHTPENAGNLDETRRLMRRDIAILNTVPGVLRANLPKADRDDIKQGARRIKFALMRDVWDSGEWGPIAEFERWMSNDEPDPPPASVAQAVRFYRYTGQP